MNDHCSCYYDDRVEDPDGLWQKCCDCGQRQHDGMHPAMLQFVAREEDA